jgi:hypothetical protein
MIFATTLRETNLRRDLAVSLGAVAMGLVVLRGAIHGELAAAVALEAIVSMIIFMGIGWVAGWICDYLVRDAVEAAFRTRVDWYRQRLIDAGFIDANTNKD